MIRVVFAVLLGLGSSFAAPVQSEAPQNTAAAQPATAQSSSAPPAGVRIVDVEQAQRAKRKEHSLKAYQAPFMPFLAVGRRMKSGLVSVEEKHLLDKARYYMAERDRGVLPLFGGLGIGTGLTLGAQYYDTSFLRPGGRIEVSARISSLLYQEYGIFHSLPLGSGRRLFFDSSAFYRVRTQDDFFGLGNESRVGGRTSYKTKSQEFLFGPRLQFTPRVQLRTRFGYRGTDAFDGEDERYPVISRLYSPLRIPGLADGARLLVGGAELEHDGRDVPGRPHRGGYHRLRATWLGSKDSNDFGFWRYEVEAQRFVPLWSRSRTLALRFVGATNQTRGGSAVPFFEQFILGGSRTMRGYREFRFYDLSGVLMTAEYRFNLNSFIDLVAFADAGQVARQPGDFSWQGMHAGWGGGVRFLTQTSTPLKIMIGTSREGTRIYFSMERTF